MVASAEDVEGDALERMQQEQLKAELWECVDSLPGQQPEVLERVRQKERGKIGAAMTNNRVGPIGHTPIQPTTLRKELAKIAGSVQRSKLILDKGTPEQIERARKGGKGTTGELLEV